MKKFLPVLVGAFVLFFIVTAPAGAADTVIGIFGWLGDIGTSIATFLQRLTA